MEVNKPWKRKRPQNSHEIETETASTNMSIRKLSDDLMKKPISSVHIKQYGIVFSSKKFV